MRKLQSEKNKGLQVFIKLSDKLEDRYFINFL